MMPRVQHSLVQPKPPWSGHMNMTSKHIEQGNGKEILQVAKRQESAVRCSYTVGAHRQLPTKTHPVAELITDHCLQLKKVFEFLKLPAEIRNMIYWNVLVKRHSCYPSARPQPPLTLVNKQIRSESLPVLYGNGLFVADYGLYPPTIENFLQVPAIPNLACITKLQIRFRFHTRGVSRLNVLINMRADKSECGSLGNHDFVGQPDLEWRDEACIVRHYARLLQESVSVRTLQCIGAFILAYQAMRSVVRVLLCFAEKCPAAAKWVWMVVELPNHMA